MTVEELNDGYASMITYMLFYISMNQGTFACIVSFGLRIETDNIWVCYFLSSLAWISN